MPHAEDSSAIDAPFYPSPEDAFSTKLHKVNHASQPEGAGSPEEARPHRSIMAVG